MMTRLKFIGIYLFCSIIFSVVLEASTSSIYKWTKVIGDSKSDEPTCIAIDNNGNIYVTGYFTTNVNFAQDWGGTDIKTNAGASDIFITKINSDGSYGWTKRIGKYINDCAKAITIDNNGNIYVTGYFTTNVNFAQDWGGTDIKTNAGVHDIFITKINSDGSYGWTKRIGGNLKDEGYGIAIDSIGNIYVSGTFGDFSGTTTVNFAQDWGETENKTSVGEADIFITKINSDGSYGWTKRIGGEKWDWASGIAIDSSDNIYITGFFRTNVNFKDDWGGTDIKTNAGASDIFITKINSDGSYGWTKRIGGKYQDEAKCISVDNSDNIYVTGFFDTNVNFAQDWSETDIKTNAGPSDSNKFDVYITKINSDGSYGWTKRIGGICNDWASGITTDENGNIYVTGFFETNVNFAQDWGGTDNKSSAGSCDIFITKINSDGTYGWTKRMGGSLHDGGLDIEIDNIGNIYVTGRFVSIDANFAQDWGETDNKLSAGDYDISITRIQLTPTAVFNLIIDYVKVDAVGLKWVDSSYEEGYKICRSKDGINFDVIGTTEKDVVQFEDKSVSKGVTYWYKVIATNESGEEHSNKVCCTIPLASPALNNIVIAPNPFNPYKSGKDYIIFFNVPQDVKIRIYNILGDNLIELKDAIADNKIIWDVKDKNGKSLVRGAYIAEIEDSKGNKRYIKFVIQR